MVWQPSIEITQEGMHKWFLRRTYEHAWNESQDTVTKNAALVVYMGTIFGHAANKYPDGLNPTEEQMKDRAWKYAHIIHAEKGAIAYVREKGLWTKGTTMFMPWVPCTPCAEGILEAGINQLIGHESMIMKTPERWWESTNNAIELLRKNGVNLLMYRGEIGDCRNLFNGEEWQP